MKKLLLLLLLPACLLGHEEKPRKLYFEIKQGVGLPSIGIKYKNQKGNYWNVGVNTYDSNIAKTIVGEKIAYTIDGAAHSLHYWVYVSFDQKIHERLFLEHGGNFTTLAIREDFYFPAFGVYSGIYYGNRISVGVKLGLAFKNSNPVNEYTMAVYFSPKIKIRI